MRYFRTLNVARADALEFEKQQHYVLARSAPSHRSAPINIPEDTRRVDDFYYKSPTEHTPEEYDESCLFEMEL